MSAPRIAPLEKPKHPIVKAAYWIIKRKLGKVITPVKVIYARYPSMLPWVNKMDKIIENDIPLDDSIKLLVKYKIAFLNRCDFCLDIGQKSAIQKHIPLEKFYNIDSFETSDLFSEKEKSALQFAKEANQQKVSDTTFDTLKKHFNDKEIIGITYIVATENYYNIMNHALEINTDGLCSI
ncbi:MAG: carboxymuconolactone decarboxylase family protein [Bacteroidetes bacterium]|nr:carboxymuconolactone decarboxylase family protein [Bacteroidota bacterium]